MADNSNCSVQNHANRVAKGSSFQGKRGETPDSPTNAQRNMSPGQSSNANSRPPTLPNNHHQGPQQQHYQNHRSYNHRGRNRDGVFYGSQSGFGSHNSGPNRRFSPGPSVPNANELAAYMNSAWEEFKKLYKENRGEDLQDEVNSNSPVITSHPIAPMSPRIPGHVNSPHRGQHNRYSHQNSTGSNWSVNNGGNGRRFPENVEHPNTGSLRRLHNNRGGGHNVSSGVSNNQSWQRGNFINRQNSPNNTLNRQGFRRPPYWGNRFSNGPRHHIHPRPVASPTPPPAMSNFPPAGNSPTPQEPAGQATTAVVVSDMMQSLTVKSHSPVENTPVKPSAPNNGGSNGNKNSASNESSKGASPSSSASSYDVETTTPTKKQGEPVNPVVSKTIAASTAKSVPPQTSTRRRAATTQGGSTCSAPAVLTLSSFLPVTRQSESASVASSSFCSLVDQVDVMSAADQYFTPEPPSSPSSISAGVKVTGSPTSTNDR